MDKHEIKTSGHESIIGIPSSILKYHGFKNHHKTLECLDEALRKGFRNVVLLVIDGMGSNILKRILPEESFLNINTIKTLKTLFPATTTAVITSLKSGVYPNEHGRIGWSMYFKEIDENIELYPNTLHDKSVFRYHVADTFLPVEDIVTRINDYEILKDASHSKVKAIEISPYGVKETKGIGNICRRILEETYTGNKYIYAYIPYFDSTMHKYGTDSIEVKKLLTKINREIEKLSMQLKDTLLIITADHGMINSYNHWIGEYPEILEMLKRLPSIEPRTMGLFVKDEYLSVFLGVFNQYLGDYYKLMTKKEVLESRIFGDGEDNIILKDSIGDFLAVGYGERAIFNRSEEVKSIVGTHGGITDDEVYVPLILFET